MDEEMEETCFQIIAQVGMAKSCFINAIEKAKASDFAAAERLVSEGTADFQKGHEAHATMLRRDASGEHEAGFSLLLVHAEDQMATAEAFRVIALDFIDVYRRVDK